MKIFMDNLMLGIQLVNISTRCSSHPQGKVNMKRGAKIMEVYDSPGYWIATMKKLAGRVTSSCAS